MLEDKKIEEEEEDKRRRRKRRRKEEDNPTYRADIDRLRALYIVPSIGPQYSTSYDLATSFAFLLRRYDRLAIMCIESLIKL